MALRIEYIAVSELMTRLHPKNPKNHDLGAIIESYRSHGYVASGVLDDRLVCSWPGMAALRRWI